MDGKTYDQNFDVQNRLTSVVEAGQTTTFRYDASGLRVMTTRPDGTLVYTPFPGFEEEVLPGAPAYANRQATESESPSSHSIVSTTRESFAMQESAAQATLTFNPTDDARVKLTSGNNNYDPGYLRLRNGTYETYVMFDVSGVSGSVSSATLRLYAYDGSDSGGSVYSVGTGWDETTITANNAPGISGTALDTVGSVSNDTWVEYDVTAAVSGNGMVSFGLDSTSTNSLYFYNKEDSNPNHPELLIVTGGGTPTDTPTPGPTSTNTPIPPPTDTPTAGPPPTVTPSVSPTPIPTATNTPVDTPTPGSGSSQTLSPTDDARVKLSSGNSNYDPGYLRLRSGTYETYLQFDVSGLSGTVSNATLRLYAYDGSDSGGSVYDVGDGWDETTITANNAPGISGTALDTPCSVSNDSWVEYDVTSAVAAAIAGDGVASLGLDSTSTNSLYFYNKEDSNPNHPELLIELNGGGGPTPTNTPVGPTSDTVGEFNLYENWSQSSKTRDSSLRSFFARKPSI